MLDEKWPFAERLVRCIRVRGCFENGVQVFYVYYVLLIYVVIFIFKESRPVKKIFSNGACSRIVRITTNRGKV